MNKPVKKVLVSKKLGWVDAYQDKGGNYYGFVSIPESVYEDPKSTADSAKSAEKDGKSC